MPRLCSPRLGRLFTEYAARTEFDFDEFRSREAQIAMTLVVWPPGPGSRAQGALETFNISYGASFGR
jgi:hypothetical protein